MGKHAFVPCTQLATVTRHQFGSLVSAVEFLFAMADLWSGIALHFHKSLAALKAKRHFKDSKAFDDDNMNITQTKA